MILNLPPLTSLNKYIDAERTNRFKAAKIKREETELVAWECRRQKVPKLKKLRTLTFIWKTKDRRQDKDNIAFSKKFCLDGMVMAGVIPNDTYNTLPNKIIDRFEIGKPGVVVVFK
jgi:hypothetical protein